MKLYKKLADKYRINRKALKRKMKESGISTKTIHPLEVMQIIYLHAPELMFTREGDFNETVEYADDKTSREFIEEYNALVKLLS